MSGHIESPRPSILLGRLEETLAASARIGAIPGQGLGRLALTDADREMRRLFMDWCRAARLEVTVDRIGNIFARRRGREQLAPVALGSHLDTQVNGGRFDGVLGVLAGLEVMRTLNDHGVATRRPLEVVCWTDEEGARFNTPMLGSSVFTGAIPVADALARHDATGVTVGNELRRIGFDGPAPVPGHGLYAYLELHIEQGAVLDRSSVDVGIVSESYPVAYVDVCFQGSTAHSGPTPMAERRNSLVGAARAITAVDGIGHAHGPDAKAGTTTISVWPNRSGIVPSEVAVRFDLRHPDRGVVEHMLSEVEAAMQNAATAANVQAVVTSTLRFGGGKFSAKCVGALERAVERRGIPSLRVPTQAGHDATVIGRRYPAAMVFCPCRDGVSHNPAEDVEMERVVPAVNVLLDAAIELADAPAL